MKTWERVPALLEGLLREVLKELAPGRVIEEKLTFDGQILEIEGRRFAGPFYLLAVGKAAWDSAAAMAPLLGEALLGGTVLTRYGGSRGGISGLTIVEAGHPLPDRAGLEATGKIIEEIRELPEEATVIVCVSGGGSALFESLRNGISLQDLVTLNRVLLASGAPIGDINEIRKGISRVKGGGLLNFIRPRTCLGLVFSDVVGDDPAMVASGPTVPEVLGERWREVCSRYGLVELLPEGIIKALNSRRETNVEGDQSYLEQKVLNVVLLGNGDLCERVRKRLEEKGFHSMILSSCISGESSEVGRFLGDVAREIQAGGNPISRPAALVTGGESVVTIRGKGRGGPNMETALAFARQVRGMKDVWFLAVDSDGSDGGTEAAGAIVTGQTWSTLTAAGSSPENGLGNNNSLPLLDEAGCLVITGTTGTNLNDLRVLLMP